MGKGKSSAALQYINDSRDKRYLYVTPYLSECQRVQIACPDLQFKEPSDTGALPTKSADLLRLLSEGQNVVLSHELFKLLNDTAIDCIKEFDYTLFLDEEIEVVEQSGITQDDLKILKEQHLIETDPTSKRVMWLNSQYHGDFERIKREIQQKALYEVELNIILWQLPPGIFEAFHQVYIMTFLFRGSMLYLYFQKNGISFQYLHVEKDSQGKYYFSQGYEEVSELEKSRIKFLLDVHDGRLNTNYLPESKKKRDIQEYSGLSSSWHQSRKNKEYINILKRNAMNYIQNYRHAPKNTVMWTTFKPAVNKYENRRMKANCRWSGRISCNECTRPCGVNFVSCNARAINRYADRTTLIYLCNIFPVPPVVQYLSQGTTAEFDADLYALAQLMQWIWRSAIRRGEAVSLYLPSARMRKLLLDWLG